MKDSLKKGSLKVSFKPFSPTQEVLSLEDDQSDGADEKGGKSRRRSPEERGLPNDKDLHGLAQTYLDTQARLWPELVTAGQLPQPTRQAARQLARQLKERFLAKEPGNFASEMNNPPWSVIGISYCRYSCDNSNPKSLDQQLRLQLERAKSEKIFIPPEHLYFDAAVTGTTAFRRGYEMAKAAIQTFAIVQVLMVDELGRASRDMIETLLLGRMVEGLGKRLLGASDGFDTNQPMWKFILSIFAAMHEWFIDQLRIKVNRGMNHAFDTGANIGIAAFGYRLVPMLDEEGRLVLGRDGVPRNRLEIYPRMARIVRAAFVLYGRREKSLDYIAKLFNKHRVNGVTWWTASRIRKLLTNVKYVGIETYRMTYRVVDPKTGKITIKTRPRSEWKVRKARHLQIVSRASWKTVQRRLEMVGEAYGRKREKRVVSRTDVYNNVLIRPVCGICGKPLSYGHAGQYPSLTCMNGKFGMNGCTFRGYKSVRIIEKCVLEYLSEHIFTAERMKELIAQANEHLQKMDKPHNGEKEVKKIESEIAAEVRKRDRMLKIVEGDDEGDSDLDSVRDRIRGIERNLKELRKRSAEAKSRAAGPPAPIDAGDAAQLLADLRGLLNRDLALAAPALKELTGPITIHQLQEPGKKKPTWIGQFTVNLVPVVLKLAQEKSIQRHLLGST